MKEESGVEAVSVGGFPRVGHCSFTQARGLCAHGHPDGDVTHDD